MCAAGDADRHEVTRILRGFDEDQKASEKLLPLVYGQLRAIAQNRMNNERIGHTLDATGLVHEVYLRLVSGPDRTWEGRRHFFTVAAEAMRKILIDHARGKAAAKRGGDRAMVPASVLDLAETPDESLAHALDEAVSALEEEDERAAMVVKYRFFAGLNVDETADLMQLSRRTVLREWQYARARLAQLMEA